MTPRRFNRGERIASYLAAAGRCGRCGRPLEWRWHADHVVPHAAGGPTDLTNVEALCPDCNQRKGASMPTPLRRWQEQAVASYFRADRRDFLLVATPAAGKTRVALEVAIQMFDDRVDRVVVVVPTTALRTQWADAFAERGRHLDPGWRAGNPIPPDVDGLAVTYQAVAANPAVLRLIATRKRTLVVFDEIHHCGEAERLIWGRAVRDAFDGAAWRLGLSGTPFREDVAPIPFVPYVDGQAVPDFTYGYAEAVAEGVCRALFFPSLGGRMEWLFGDQLEAMRLEDADGRDQRRALRTAIMPDGDWIAEAIDVAHGRLVEARAADPDAAGLLICDEIRHAERLAAVLRERTGLGAGDVTLVTSDDDEAPAAIKRFRGATSPWIVAVRMVSEGVDIPRLRVLLWATAAKTELLFRQVVGRVVRCQAEDDDHTAWVVLPADRELLEWAEQVAQERTHALGLEQERLLGELDGEREPGIFMPVSSEGELGRTIVDGSVISAAELQQAERARAATAGAQAVAVETVALLLRRADPRPTSEPEPDGQAPHERREQLRRANDKAVRAIGMRHGVDFKEINWRLNQAVGVRTIGAATVEDLERRLRFAKRWLDTGEAP